MDFYISKSGKKGNPGTSKRPFATFEEARDDVAPENPDFGKSYVSWYR